MDERRKHQRHRVFRSATIAFNRAAGISCTIRDLSEGGACLNVESPIGIPDAFVLATDGPQVMRPCRVVWRSNNRIGVAFQSIGSEQDENYWSAPGGEPAGA